MGHSVKAIALILLSALSCFGQAFTFNDLAFVCQSNAVSVTPWAPTNAYGWWHIDSVTANNGDQIGYVPDSAGSHPLWVYGANTNTYAPYWTNVVWSSSNHIALYFDGVNRALTNAFGSTLSQPLTFFIVVRMASVSIGRYLFDSISATPRIVSTIGGSNFTLSINAGSAMTGPAVISSTATYLFTIGISNNLSFIRTNGVDYVRDGTSIGTAGSKGFTLGNRYDALTSTDFIGYFYEAILYSGTSFMAAGDQAWVENNLKYKYGL